MRLRLYDKAMHAVRFWLLRILPTCKRAVAMISESMERRLSLRERVWLKLHLWVCAWCLWYQEHLLTMRETLRKQSANVEEDDPPSAAGLSPEARERIKRALSGQGR
jgi:hypothetical protein